MTGSLLLVGVELDGRRADVRVSNGSVVSVAARLRPRLDDDVVEAHGGALLPGLHDHHIHLLALAAHRRSTVVGPPDVRDESQLRRALSSADRSLRPGRWLRATGYHESVAGELDAGALDRFVAERPVRVQHRSGAMWVLNTRALEAIAAGVGGGSGIERDSAGRPTGRLFGLDERMRPLFAELDSPDPLPLAEVGRELASYGVTGVADLTPTRDPRDFELLAQHGDVLPNLMVTGSAQLSAPDVVLDRGPVKLRVDDHRLPSIDELVAEMATARRLMRRVAVHCVSRVGLLLALAAWDDIGPEPGDRIEHGSVIGPEELQRIARAGLTVVTQPNFVAERGDDYRRDVDPIEQPWLYRCGSLLAAGVPTGFGTDAPYGHPDPWRAVDAAVRRRTLSGAVLGASERVDARAALDRVLAPLHEPGGAARRVTVGSPTDLCLLSVPLGVALEQRVSSGVAMTIRRGAVTFSTS